MDQKEAFYRQFQATSANIREQINQLPTLSAVGGERQDAIDEILAGISRLSQDVADAADFVPAYDQRGYSTAVKGLKEELEQTTARIAPKKSRFQFKPRVTATKSGSLTTNSVDESRRAGQEDTRRFVPSPNYLGRDEGTEASNSSSRTSPNNNDSNQSTGRNYNEVISSGTGTAPRRPSFSSARDVVISDQQKKHIILPESASKATSAGGGRITNIRDCIIDMSIPTTTRLGTAPFANLALKNISGSVIVAGRIDGSVHITGVRDSVLVIVSRQVRIHECEGVDFYLFCASHPIIEDCKGVRFAPAPDCFMTEKENPETNQWDQVDDFKWLKSEHSPNWCVLPEEERIPKETWDMVKGTHVSGDLGLEDIVKKIGLGNK